MIRLSTYLKHDWQTKQQQQNGWLVKAGCAPQSSAEVHACLPLALPLAFSSAYFDRATIARCPNISDGRSERILPEYYTRVHLSLIS